MVQNYKITAKKFARNEIICIFASKNLHINQHFKLLCYVKVFSRNGGHYGARVDGLRCSS